MYESELSLTQNVYATETERKLSHYDRVIKKKKPKPTNLKDWVTEDQVTNNK